MITKNELVTAMAEHANLTKKDTEKALRAFTETVTEFLVKGEAVQMIGFGTFETRQRAARQARNPQTGEKIDIPALTAPAFKAGKNLKEAVR